MHYKTTIILAAAGVATASTILPVKRALPAGWSAAGCNTDDWNRSLPNQVTVSGSFTHDKCVAACDAAGYTIAGSENGKECYCGFTLGGSVANAGDCSTPCAGSSSQKCGGGWRLSISKKSTSGGGGGGGGGSTSIPSGWSSVGCYTDSWTRTLGNQVTPAGAFSMTSCINACSAAGYSYAGAENGNECYCAPSIASSGSKAADGDCSTNCQGLTSQKCGGGWRLSVYKKAAAPFTPPAGWTAAGCYTDSAQRSLTKYSTSSNSMTIPLCISACQQRGWQYAGMEAGKECYCGDVFANGGSKGSDGDCTTPCTGDATQTCGGGWRLSVYQNSGLGSGPATTPTQTPTTTPTSTPTTTPTGSSTYPGKDKGWVQEGCYTDDWSRTLQGYSVTSDTQTVEACQDICYQQKFKYAGLEAGSECYCADNIQNGQKVGNSDCATACKGSNSEICGGGWRLSVYSHTPATSGPSTFEQVGCFVDSANARFLRDYTPNLGNKNTPDACITACAAKGYGYAGVEYGSECYCGDQLWNVQSKDNSECNVMACPGDGSKKCGAGNRIMLYQDTLGWCS